MDFKLLSRLKEITDEEKRILDGSKGIEHLLYSDGTSSKFIINSEKLLEQGCMIEVRTHTRFIDFPKHSHDYVELVYMCSGTTRHIINDKEKITMKEGDLLFLSQNASHEILASGYNDIAVNFIILPEFFKKGLLMIERENLLRDFIIHTLSGKNSNISYLHFSAKNILPVQNLIENMIWTLFADKKQTNTLNQTTMGLLFMNLSKFVDNLSGNVSDKYDENIVFSILEYIDNNYKNGSLSDVCSTMNIPTYSASRLLKKFTNYNFKQLLQERKLQQASYLLQNTPQSIESIVDNIGYDNSSFFYRIFKEKYGCSPKSYREKYQ